MIKILTDTTSNITPEDAKELGITLLPLTVIFGTEEYRDGIDITPEEFYDKLKKKGTPFPRTSQINSATFEEEIRKAEANGDTLLIMPISSVLSGTYHSACMAKEAVGYDKAYVYDSLGTTAMLKILVLEAVKMADRPIEEVLAHLNSVRPRIELYAIMDTFEYLHKGGRLNRATALIGNLLHIKPTIHVEPDGKVKLAAKNLGFKAALKSFQKLVKPEEIDTNFPFFYIYTATKDKCKTLIETLHPNNPEYLDSAINMNPVIGSHVGSNGAGIVFVRKA